MQTTASANNVVRLPTAAAKRVQQPGPLLQPQLVAEQDIPRLPSHRATAEARRPWEEVSFMRSAEMIVATAVFSVLTDAQKARVRKSINTIAFMTPHAEAASYIVERLK